MDTSKLQMSFELPGGLSSAETASLCIKYGSEGADVHPAGGRGVWMNWRRKVTGYWEFVPRKAMNLLTSRTDSTGISKGWSLYDAPKPGLDKYFREWRNARVRVKIVSGDYAGTVINIAKREGLDGGLEALTGDQVMLLSSAQLAEKVKEVDIYARMFPEAKA